MGVGFSVAGLHAARSSYFTHQIDEPALDLSAGLGGLLTFGVDTQQTKSRVEFIDVSQSLDPGVFFGDAMTEQEISFPLVTAAGSDRHGVRYVREGDLGSSDVRRECTLVQNQHGKKGVERVT